MVSTMTSCVIQVLNLHASVTAPASVLQELHALFPGIARPPATESPLTTMSLLVTWDSEERVWEVMEDGAGPNPVPPESLLAYLEWIINLTAVTNLRSQYLLLHAGAVAHRGAGMLLCAASGSGKSTLTAGLVAHGFQYLSDEIAVIDPDDLLLFPYPRSICVKEGSRASLQPHFPQLTTADVQHRFGGEPVWYLQPPFERWCTNPVPVRFVIFPRYIEGAPTELTEISRSTAAEHLVRQSFTGDALGAQGIGAIVRLLQGADCFTLTTGNLPEAMTSLRNLMSA